MLQDVLGLVHSLSEFRTLVPTHIALGTCSRGGNAGSAVFVVRRDLAVQFYFMTVGTIVVGRIAILHLRAAPYNLDMVGLDLV